MSLNKYLFAVALAAPLGLSACGGDATFELAIDQFACNDPERKFPAIPAAAEVKIEVTGKGMDPVHVTTSGSSRTVDLPDVPFGSDRVATVSAMAGGRLVAFGRSKPFELSSSDTPRVTVVVQPVNAFTSAADITNECVEMTTQRAAHTAVALQDGKVLIVGGARSFRSGGRVDGFIATAEMYDPSIGTFVPVKAPCVDDVCYDVAFGRGIALPDGRALVAGGLGKEGNAVATAMIFEPATEKWTAVPMSVPRYGHTLHLVGGKVLVVGGIDADKTVLDSTEIFHPAGENANTFTEGPTIPGSANGDVVNNGPGRAFHAGASINANTVMVGGGVDTNYDPAPALLYFLADKGEITSQTRQVLKTPVVQAAAGVIAEKFVMVGGTEDMSATMEGVSWIASGATREVQVHEPSSAPGSDRVLQLGDPARYGACVVPMDENRLLVTGGIEPMHSAIKTAEVLVWNKDKKMVERSFVGDSADRSMMAEGRAWATCTNLGDGRILVAGGANGEQGNAGSSAEIFTIRTR